MAEAVIDPLPDPVSHLSHEIVESKDAAVIRGVSGGKAFRHLYSASQIDWYLHVFTALKLQMEEAGKIAAGKG